MTYFQKCPLCGGKLMQGEAAHQENFEIEEFVYDDLSGVIKIGNVNIPVRFKQGDMGIYEGTNIDPNHFDPSDKNPLIMCALMGITNPLICHTIYETEFERRKDD